MDHRSIAYTATLVKYVADITGKELMVVSTLIGDQGLSRLIYNAPMNRLLPLKQIAVEVIHDYDIRSSVMNEAIPDAQFGNTVADQVMASASKEELGVFLLATLTKK